MDDFAKLTDGQPREQFREELHRALESTHRQHMAQNVLGIQRSGEEDGSWYNLLGKYTLLIVIGAVVYYTWHQKTKQMEQKKNN